MSLLERKNEEFAASVSRSVLHYQSAELKDLLKALSEFQKNRFVAQMKTLHNAYWVWHNRHPNEFSSRGGRAEELLREIHRHCELQGWELDGKPDGDTHPLVEPAAHRRIQYIWQGMTLSCWKRSLEMLMLYTHNNRYGVDQHGLPREGHVPEVDQKYFGGLLSDVAASYGLVPANVDGREFNRWRNVLTTRGPILCEGNYGPARYLYGGHVILVIGCTADRRIIYLDPFLGLAAPSDLTGIAGGGGRANTSTRHYSYCTIEYLNEQMFQTPVDHTWIVTR
jgi:hypothetical protein